MSDLLILKHILLAFQYHSFFLSFFLFLACVYFHNLFSLVKDIHIQFMCVSYTYKYIYTPPQLAHIVQWSFRRVFVFFARAVSDPCWKERKSLKETTERIRYVFQIKAILKLKYSDWQMRSYLCELFSPVSKEYERVENKWAKTRTQKWAPEWAGYLAGVRFRGVQTQTNRERTREKRQRAFVVTSVWSMWNSSW